MRADLILYERAGCHLCEDIRVLLDEVLGREGYRRVDVDESDDLVLRYGFRVPVLASGGRDLLEAPITAAEVREVVRQLIGRER